jgi:hypothetical protein
VAGSVRASRGVANVTAAVMPAGRPSTDQPAPRREADADVMALRDLLADLIDVQNDMHSALEGQLDAMSRADIDGMQVAAAKITALSRRFELLDVQRQAVVSRLARRGGRRDSVALSELIPCCPDSYREELSRLGTALRDRMLAVADAGRVSNLVCREMSAHFQSVFEAMTRAAAPSGYSRDGRMESGPVHVLNAVG